MKQRGEEYRAIVGFEIIPFVNIIYRPIHPHVTLADEPHLLADVSRFTWVQEIRSQKSTVSLIYRNQKLITFGLSVVSLTYSNKAMSIERGSTFRATLYSPLIPLFGQ